MLHSGPENASALLAKTLATNHWLSLVGGESNLVPHAEYDEETDGVVERYAQPTQA